MWNNLYLLVIYTFFLWSLWGILSLSVAWLIQKEQYRQFWGSRHPVRLAVIPAITSVLNFIAVIILHITWSSSVGNQFFFITLYNFQTCKTNITNTAAIFTSSMSVTVVRTGWSYVHIIQCKTKGITTWLPPPQYYWT